MSIFSSIKRQIVQNVNDAETGVSSVNCFTTNGWQAAVIGWLTKQGVFHLDGNPTKIEKKQGKYGKYWVYEIKYKDLNINHSFFRNSGIRGRKDSEEELKSDRMSRGTHSGYNMTPEGYYEDRTIYEHLDPRDNCCLEIVLNQLGYDTYEDYVFIKQRIGYSEASIRQELSDEIQKFYKEQVAPEYSYEVVESELDW